MYGTIWALLPPVVAIVLALITKEGCTPTEWREEQVANAAPDDKKQD